MDADIDEASDTLRRGRAVRRAYTGNPLPCHVVPHDMEERIRFHQRRVYLHLLETNPKAAAKFLARPDIPAGTTKPRGSGISRL